MPKVRLAPNKFSLRVKALVGVPLAALVVGGILYDPHLYIKIVALLTLPVAVAYPVYYSRLPWKRTILGRALMTKARAVALLYITGVIGTYWPYPFEGYVLSLVTTYLGIAIGFQFIVMVRVQNEAGIYWKHSNRGQHDYSAS